MNETELDEIQTQLDELEARWFMLGWNAAIKECKLQLENGRWNEFMHEQRREFDDSND
jgi:hypothetical protein